MAFDQDSAVKRATEDLAGRLGVGTDMIEVRSVAPAEFPDMSLGAPASDEMAAQMIAYGWKIKLRSAGRDFEYRADKYQIRLKDFEGRNHIVVY